MGSGKISTCFSVAPSPSQLLNPQRALYTSPARAARSRHQVQRTRRATPVAKVVRGKKADSPAAERGLQLERRSLETETRNNRSLRARRWTTLGEIDAASSSAEQDARVDVSVLARRAGHNFHVLGAAQCQLARTCDRCNAQYQADCTGRFEVWLVAQGEVDGAEAVEEFGVGVPEVDLGEHVRDAVLLGVPTKSLCSVECQGVPEVSGDFGTVRYAGQAGSTAGNALGELGRAMKRGRKDAKDAAGG